MKRRNGIAVSGDNKCDTSRNPQGEKADKEVRHGPYNLTDKEIEYIQEHFSDFFKMEVNVNVMGRDILETTAGAATTKDGQRLTAVVTKRLPDFGKPPKPEQMEE